jgi:hypothetical protein
VGDWWLDTTGIEFKEKFKAGLGLKIIEKINKFVQISWIPKINFEILIIIKF